MVVPELSDGGAGTLGWWCRKSRMVVPEVSDRRTGLSGTSGGAEVEAEGVAGRVEDHAYVVLRLEVGELAAELDGVCHR